MGWIKLYLVDLTSDVQSVMAALHCNWCPNPLGSNSLNVSVCYITFGNMPECNHNKQWILKNAWNSNHHLSPLCSDILLRPCSSLWHWAFFPVVKAVKIHMSTSQRKLHFLFFNDWSVSHYYMNKTSLPGVNCQFKWFHFHLTKGYNSL